MGERAPLDAHACYLVANLRRYVDARRAAIGCGSARFVPALAVVERHLDRAGRRIDRVEAAVVQLMDVAGTYQRLAARELVKGLEVVRAYIAEARELEVDAMMRERWEAIGGSG